MAGTTPSQGIPYAERPDPFELTADLRGSFNKIDSVFAQTRGESTAALTAAQVAEVKAAQALLRALAIEDPVFVGPEAPVDGSALWVDTDADPTPAPVGDVTAADIVDSTEVGRNVLTAPLSVDARNALSIFAGTRALLDAGTDTAERTWDAKELSEYVTETAENAGGATSWDDLTDKPAVFPASPHTHDDRYFTESEVDAKIAAITPYKSGLRGVQSLLEAGFTAAWVYVVRDGSTVSVHVTNLVYSGTETGTVRVMLFPLGFTPYATAQTTSTRGKGGLITASGVFQITGTPSGSVDSMSFTYLTPDAPPTTLPGVPV